MQFFNRSDEIKLLSARMDSDSADLLVVYGRRRIGKTELLTHLADKKRAFYFEATDSVATDQLRDFTAELALVSDSQLLTVQQLTHWDAALTAIADFVGTKRTVVILDEFQLLARQAPELESVLSRWWRTTGRFLPITLVLAGSEISFFEDEILAGRLYGRRTGQLKLEPFLAKESALFHPEYSEEDRVRVYSVCGGIPYYLERFSGKHSLRTALLNEVFERTGLLHDEAELMLRQSVKNPTNHIAVIRAIAHGYNRNNDIVQRTELSSPHITKILGTLERLGLIEQLRPITASPRSKKTAYALKDHFLRFNYRFVEPAKSQLRTRALAANYVDSLVMPQLDHYVSLGWEEICRQYVHRAHAEVSAVGRWWGPVPVPQSRRTEEREVDVAGIDATGKLVAVGMCKWTGTQVDFDELNLLDRLREHIPGNSPETYRYLFSCSGFTARVSDYAKLNSSLKLVTPKDIYR